jgi:hypothetical protein
MRTGKNARLYPYCNRLHGLCSLGVYFGGSCNGSGKAFLRSARSCDDTPKRLGYQWRV